VKPTLAAIKSSGLPLAVVGIGALLAAIGIALGYMRRRTK
jgi:hypothetical protein